MLLAIYLLIQLSFSVLLMKFCWYNPAFNSFNSIDLYYICIFKSFIFSQYNLIYSIIFIFKSSNTNLV